MIINNKGISLAVTGISALKLFGARYTDEVYSSSKVKLIVNVMVRFLELNPQIRKVYIGMSSGIDLLFGIAVYKFKQRHGQNSIELICCITGSGQTKGYTEEEKAQYHLVLRQTADKVERITGPKGDADKDKNKFIVKNADMTISFWNLIKLHSGTFSTMNFSRKQCKPVYLFDSENLRENGVWWNAPESDSTIRINPVWRVEESTPGELLAAGYAEQ